MIPPLTVYARPKKSKALGVFVGFVIGVAIGLGLIPIGENIGLVLGIAVIGWIPAVIVHELGHALGARLAGFRLLQLYLGPFRITNTTSRWRVETSMLFALRGACLSAPSEWRGDRAARRELFWFFAGGSLANFVFGVPLLFGGLAMKTLGAMSILAGVLSWIPMEKRGPTDGAYLLRIFRRSPARLRLSALGLLAQTMPPAQWPQELVANLQVTIEDRAMASRAAILAYYESLDRGDAAFALEAAIFEGAWRRDAQAARAWLERGKAMASEDRHGSAIARAAIAFAEGDHATTAALVRGASVDPPRSSVWLRRATIELLGGGM